MPSEVIWLRPERSGVGRPPGRSRAEIATVAIALADRAGLDAVTMHALARELGTRAASLYRYVDTRDELLDLMTDQVLAELDLGAPSGRWLDDLVRFGLRVRDVHRRHPWLAERITTRPGFGPRGADVLEFVLAALADHPADDDTKLVAYGTLNAVVISSVQSERTGQDLGRHAAFVAHLVAEGRHPTSRHSTPPRRTRDATTCPTCCAASWKASCPSSDRGAPPDLSACCVRSPATPHRR